MTKDEALKLALEAQERMKLSRDYVRLPGYPLSDADRQMEKSTAALREALAQPDQEYDRGFSNGWDKCAARQVTQPDNTAKLYEELRVLIDGGSESFTHKDAVQYLKDNLASLKWTPADMANRPGGLAQREQEPWCMKINGCKTKCEDCPDEPVNPEQEPVAWMYPADLKKFETSECFADAFSISVGSPTLGVTVPMFTSPPRRQPTEERNFCPRCGKRLASGFVEISIHTCTPPAP